MNSPTETDSWLFIASMPRAISDCGSKSKGRARVSICVSASVCARVRQTSLQVSLAREGDRQADRHRGSQAVTCVSELCACVPELSQRRCGPELQRLT
eukprot:338552-Rhodomonas_salina.1